MMTADAPLGYAGAPMNEGHGTAGFSRWEASEGTAQDAMGPDLATNRREQARDRAVWMFKQGRSAAKVWEELVSSGVEQAVAEEVVKEVMEQRRKLEAVAQEAAIEASFYRQQEALGSFWKGALFAFFFTGIALIASLLSSSMGSETKKGIHVTAAVKVFLLIVLAIAAGPR